MPQVNPLTITAKNGDEIAVTDRPAYMTLLASSTAASAFAGLTAEIAAGCADGCLSEDERHRVQVEILALESQLEKLKGAVG